MLNHEYKNNTYLEDYRAAIRDGKINAGHELIDLLDRLLEEKDSGEYTYNTEEADIRIEFIESCCFLTKAEYYGRPFILELWEKAFITAAYSFYMMTITSIDEDDKEVYGLVRRFTEILLLIARKNGKALALDTRIPTPSGDRTMGDIAIGDIVYAVDGTPSRVIGTSPIYRDHDCFEVEFEDGEVITADADHRWAVETKQSRRVDKYVPTTSRQRHAHGTQIGGLRVMTTRDMAGDFRRLRKDGKGYEYKYRVPMAEAVEAPSAELLIPPYTLGVWLGDGKSQCNYIYGSENDLREICSHIESEGVRCGAIRSDHTASFVLIGEKVGKHNHIKTALKDMGLINNKHIPPEYLSASAGQRLALLQGLMDTDGTCSKAGQCEFVQKSKQLTEDVSKLLTSLGIKHTIKSKTAKCNGKDCGTVYRVTFYTDKRNPCFRMERKAQRLKGELVSRMRNKSIVYIRPVESVPVKCIAIDHPSHLYLCGERNTVTHNTELMAALAFAELVCAGNAMDICVGSNDDEQSKILFTAVGTMKEQADPHETFLKMSQKVIRTKNKSTLFRMSDKMRNMEGRLLPRAYIDEACMMSKDAKLARAVVQSTSVLNDAMVFYLTSEGMIVDGFLDSLTKRGREFIKGESDERRFLPWMYTQDEPEAEIFAAAEDGNWKLLQKSNPNIGKIKKLSYIYQELEKAKTDRAHRLWVMNKDFTYKQTTAAAWLDYELYTYPQEQWTLEDFRDCVCIAGADMAEAVDLNALTLLFMRRNGEEIDPTFYLFHHFWIPEGKTKVTDDKFDYKAAAESGDLTIVPGDIVDTSIIADYLLELQTNYGIIPMIAGYDLKFAVAFKQKMQAYGYPTEVIIQAPAVLNNAIRYTEQLFRSKSINYNTHPVQKWCLGNASLMVNQQNQALIVKRDNDRRNRIDGPVSTVICIETYIRHRSEFINYIK